MIDNEDLELRIEQGETDEVERILGEGTGGRSGTDEAKAQLLQGLLFFRSGDYKGAISALKQGREIAERSGLKRLGHHIMNYLIWVGLKAGVKKMIHEVFNELEHVQEKLGNREMGFFLLNHAFAVSMDIGFIESEKFSDRLVRNALESLKSAERTAGRKDPVLRLRSRMVKALLLQQMEQWDQAHSILEGAVDSARSEGLPFLKGDLLEELGNLHYRHAEELRGVDPSHAEKRYRLAGDVYGKALEVWKGRNRDQEGVLSSALGDVHYRREDYTASWDYHRASLEIFEELEYPHGEGLQLMALGKVALRRDQVRDGISYLKKALRIFRKLDVRHERTLTRVHLVDGYFLLSRRKGKKALKKLLYNEPVKRYLDCYRELREVVRREDWLRDDPDLKELFEKPPPRFITLELLEQIIQAAKKSHPNEFGGLIHGDPIMDRLEFVLDSAKGKDTFMFSLYNRYSGDYMYADGSVHSHPSGAATPSKADLSFFGKFPSVNIIIGYPYALDSWAAYDRNGNKVRVGVIYRDNKEMVQARLDKLNRSTPAKPTKTSE